MASSLDLSPIDFCGKQVMDFKETLYTSTFQNPAIGELLTVVPGIKAKQQIVILGLIEIVGRTAQTGTCAPDVSTQQAESIQKLWDPQYVEDRFKECWKDLLAKFTVWGLKNNIKKADLTGTDFANFLEDRVLDGLKQSIYRIVWFADKSAALIANGGKVSDTVTLSDGNTTAMDIRYINAIDGIWKQLFTIGTAHATQRTIIARNYGGIATPGAPSLATATTGGTVAAGTYYVQLAAVNASGETPLGAVASQVTTGSTSTITVTTGALPTGATGFKAYISTTSGTYTKYFTGTGSPIVITAPPASGTTGTPVTLNGATTYAGQQFTAQDTTDQVITNYLQGMIDHADTRLSSDPNVKFFVTKSVADQYRRERRLQIAGVEMPYLRTEQGWLYLELSGVPIIVLDFEDRFIRMFFNDGVSLFLPHRIYMATTDNIQMGVEEEDTMTMIDAFFVQESKYYYLDTGYTIDAKVIEDYRVAVGY